ncbi:2Fe-2S iron-sulfur cluster-binding protein [Lentibacter sp. XHP0401]|jgi:ferredoxin, 2Fe-2S|uniref:2Fe-2S iron-sulfur cluster-binding protein n=1 Tax=Lentibacter sp. XHP0401 TaxID=2984334 RepID=UPI0021E86C90|nr:2Fe-2S iron-sulfur cluster-binding protein [Lentibacter sp. XHP0401]MCV2893261.1 2Fe-2S iron-sulfur cluster-binding protein [Lentibacter sp. XHP0401]
MNVTWKLPDGSEISADVADGTNMMEAAVANNVPNVIGECGGSLACATCHVYVDEAWVGKTGSVEDFEDAMLDATEAEREPNSRLSCQIVASDDLDGLMLIVPQA